MHTPSKPTRPLPGLVPLVLLCGVLSVTWIVTPEHQSKAASAPVDGDALTALVTKLKSQRETILANQTKIEAQTAALKEQLDQAKNFAHRIR